MPHSGLKRPLQIFIIHPSGFLTDHLGNGDGLVAWAFLAELAARGHQLHVAVDRYSIECEVPSNLHLYPIRTSIEHPILRRLHYMLFVRLLYARLSRRITFDVMQQMNAVFLGLSLAMIGVRVPLILGTYVPRWPDTAGQSVLLKRVRGFAVAAIAYAQQRRASALLLTSPASLARIAANAAIRAKVRYVEHGIDAQLLAREERSPLRETVEILFVGALARKKGVFVLIDAFERLWLTNASVRLTLIGAGPDASSLQARVESSPARECICLTGAVPRAQIPAILRKCDIFCLPSFGEPYANVLIEAMACEKPIVATDSPGVASLLNPSGSFLVEAGDAIELARVLGVLAGSLQMRVEFGEANRRAVVERFTIERVVDKLETIYAEVLSVHATSRVNSRS